MRYGKRKIVTGERQRYSGTLERGMKDVRGGGGGSKNVFER